MVAAVGSTINCYTSNSEIQDLLSGWALVAAEGTTTDRYCEIQDSLSLPWWQQWDLQSTAVRFKTHQHDGSGARWDLQKLTIDSTCILAAVRSKIYFHGGHWWQRWDLQLTATVRSKIQHQGGSGVSKLTAIK